MLNIGNSSFQITFKYVVYLISILGLLDRLVPLLLLVVGF